MNEMTMLRDHRDSQPDPTPAAVAEVRARLTARARSGPARASRRPVLSRRRRYALFAAGVAGAAAVAVIAPAVIGDQGDQAYAVERLPNGTIKVTLREFTDSAGLQRKLNTLGVRAVVDYLPRDMRCSTEPRATPDDTVQPQLEVVEDQNAYVARPTPTRAGDHTFYIHPERIRPGQILLWTMNYDRDALTRDRGYAVGTITYLTRGPVKPCKPTRRTWQGGAPGMPHQAGLGAVTR